VRSRSIDPKAFVETDFFICPDCETIYKRVITPKIEWVELNKKEEG